MSLLWENLPYGRRGIFADHDKHRYIIKRKPYSTTYDLYLDGKLITAGYTSESIAKAAAERKSKGETL